MQEPSIPIFSFKKFITKLGDKVFVVDVSEPFGNVSRLPSFDFIRDQLIKLIVIH